MDNIEFVDGEYLSLGILPDGNLLITLTSEGWNRRAEIEHLRDERGINAALYRIFETFDEMGTSGCAEYAFTADLDWWGHLFSGPGFTDDYHPADWEVGLTVPDMGHFWVNPMYAIEDEIETLYSKGYMIWQYHQNY